MSFSEFWTNENNPSLPKSEYLYGTRHLIVLLITVLAIVVFTLLFIKRSDRSKRILFKVFASILLFFEIASRVVNLIITTDYSIENIANQLGYTDAKYLSKCFKKAKGISPLQYRKQRIIE